MTDKEAEQILDWLTGCFSKRLEENERLVWLTTLLDLDANRAMEIALQIGKNGERFPSVPEFRRSVRTVQTDESWREGPAEPLPVPEWVAIWQFMRANEDTRILPQQYLAPGEESMSQAEYEEERRRWTDAGSPRFSFKKFTND